MAKTIKYLPPPITAPRYSGIQTFMRLPNVRTTEDVDFAVLGAPYDCGASYKNGSRFGPQAIRTASTLMRNYSYDVDVNIFEYLSGVDYGDLDTFPGHTQESYDSITKGLQPIVDAGVIPITMGGDHSITLPELRAVAKKHGPVALVHFDSHLDTWDTYWGLKYAHGTPFRRACEEGLLDTAHSVQVGIRGSQYGPEDIQGSLDLGFQVITANELHEMGWKECVKKINERVGTAKTFLTFDIDFVDPSMAPGTGTIEVGGFTGYESMMLVAGLKDLNFVAMDMVEVLPVIDQTGRTAYMAASLMHQMISLLALQRKNGKR
ncbi:MAG: agmatinase [Planctomycetes bacterium]|nr:agmatinase [Planctomycetota bacterium]